MRSIHARSRANHGKKTIQVEATISMAKIEAVDDRQEQVKMEILNIEEPAFE
jgi:hypothetical protein